MPVRPHLLDVVAALTPAERRQVATLLVERIRAGGYRVVAVTGEGSRTLGLLPPHLEIPEIEDQIRSLEASGLLGRLCWARFDDEDTGYYVSWWVKPWNP